MIKTWDNLFVSKNSYRENISISNLSVFLVPDHKEEKDFHSLQLRIYNFINKEDVVSTMKNISNINP